MRLRAFVVLNCCVLFAGPLSAHPVSVAHPHNADTIEWQIDWFPELFIGAPTGLAAHNHHTDRSFGGVGQEFRNPYIAIACWDSIAYRVDLILNFDKGHCFIDEFDPVALIPQFTFSTAGSMPEEAKNRIRDAFAEYGINELSDQKLPETRFRGLWTTPRRRLRGGSNLFALGPPNPCFMGSSNIL